MKKALLLVGFIPLLAAGEAEAQSWGPLGQRTAVWVQNPTLGDGSGGFGGVAPAYAFEPAAIGAIGYTASQWITTPNNDGVYGNGEDYTTKDEAIAWRPPNGLIEEKFRITCNFSHFAKVDPILAYGSTTAAILHHHTFIGNKSTDQNSTYQTLRNNPASTCSGGPLNGTAYWEPTVFVELAPGIYAPLKPDVISFYYTHNEGQGPRKSRLMRTLAFIGGVNPGDPDNTLRQAEIPVGQGFLPAWDGWVGWQCYAPGIGNISVVNGPQAGGTYSRQLKNADGSDPWNGTCIAGYKLIANIIAPKCWDGWNPTSSNGRDHFRYPIVHSQAQSVELCPNGWYEVPVFEVKTEFSHGGWADYSRWFLSSDRMSSNPANWRPNGSTMHFDWMNGWQQDIMDTWNAKCNNMTIAGQTSVTAECNDSTISDTQKLKVLEASPDPNFSNNPIITFNNYYNSPASVRFGPLETGTIVSGVVHSTHS